MRANPQTVKQIMESVPVKEGTKPKKVANNTVEYYRPSGERVIRYHDTDILVFALGGKVTITSGGFRTKTTLERLNDFGPLRIYQRQHKWYVARPFADHQSNIFFDGMQYDAVNGKVINAQKGAMEDKRVARIEKQIDAYCAKLRKLMDTKGLPAPDGGDCWYCYMHTGDGKPLGDVAHCDHIQAHLKEKYIMGSLTINALREAGWSDSAIAYHCNFGKPTGSKWQKASITRAIKKYFRNKMGV